MAKKQEFVRCKFSIAVTDGMAGYNLALTDDAGHVVGTLSHRNAQTGDTIQYGPVWIPMASPFEEPIKSRFQRLQEDNAILKEELRREKYKLAELKNMLRDANDE